MPRSRLPFFEPVLSARLDRTSARFAALKARVAQRLQAVHGPGLTAATDAHEHEITVASYNVHKCVGTDRRFDPARIATVIAELDADLVAIQEADERFGRRRGLLDLDAMRHATGLSLVPISQAADGHGWHGNALLMRNGRVTATRRLALPGGEPRGALIAELELPAGRLRIVAAHLGLLRRSRRWQVRAILSAIEEGPAMPTLIVGDLNEWRPGRRSSLHGFSPIFGPLPSGLLSFPSYFPVAALDRVIGTPGLVKAIRVHDSPLARVASDHLPLKARLDVHAAAELMQAQAA